MSKFFVIAGNKVQADIWIKKDIEKRISCGETSMTLSHYVYVHDAKQLRGVSNPHGVFIGTWKERWDIREVVETLITQSTLPIPQLREIWGEVKDKVKPTPKKVFVGRGVTGVWLHEYGESVNQAADSLAKEIDDAVMRTISRKVNGGII